MTGRVILSTNDSSVHAIDRDGIFDLLMNARQADWVDLELKDGRMLAGAIIFNEFKGTGRLINIDEEISVDFRASDVRSVKF
ncbi:MAG TPA: hypothetical protein PKE00_01270 [Planctomycetota bacterium]|nr:hypothetical protein [Planctomycetota bacterium]